MSIAAVEDLEVFTADVTAAYMNTTMPDEVKHKWVRLDKDVTEILLEISKEYYLPFVQADGTMAVKNNKLMHGYVEASFYWYNTIAKVFVSNGWKKCMKDKCMFVKHVEEKVAMCGLTVDDCLFAAMRNEEWIKEHIDMLYKVFNEITVVCGDELGIVGMQVKIDRNQKVAILAQPKWENNVLKKFDMDKKTPSPALVDFMADDEESELLKDHKRFMSLNSLMMYEATRT